MDFIIPNVQIYKINDDKFNFALTNALENRILISLTSYQQISFEGYFHDTNPKDIKSLLERLLNLKVFL